MQKIYLVRHGTTEGNQKRLYYGSTDLPLAPQGREEVLEYKALGRYPKPQGLSFFTSGMLRAEQTFGLIYGDEQRQTLSDIREVCFGEFEMKSHEQLLEYDSYRQYLEAKAKIAPPGGEHPNEFVGRVMRGIDRLIKEAKTSDTLAVCHGGVIGVAMLRLFPHIDRDYFGWSPLPGLGYALNINAGAVQSFEEL
jgi:alpha-ribazole phosphatase